MDMNPDIADSPEAKDIPVHGEVRYESVSFGYHPAEHILHRINLQIQPGETVAFVGPSGAGKTTLCSLLPRFYEVMEGHIYIDGHDIQDFTLHSLRNQIGIVQQDVFLFSGTIRENIAYGRLDATDEEIIEAAEKAS